PRAGGREKAFELRDASRDARALCHHHLVDAEVTAELVIDSVAEVARLGAPVRRLDQLLGAERDQHADDDDPDLAGERAPAVERLWQMDMHGKPPSRTARVGAGTFRSMARELFQDGRKECGVVIAADGLI